MAKNPRTSQTNLSRKHQDRLHREQRQTRWITFGSITIIALVILIIAYGYLDQRYFRFMRTVANVNGERISANEFRSFTKYYRNNLIQNAESTYQLASMFGSDTNALQSFGDQLVQIANELDPERAGNQAINQLVDDKLIRQEAKNLGITVSPEEVETEMQAALRFYANGTPTPTQTRQPVATSTLSATQLAMVPPTSTPLPTATAAQELTATESLTATVASTPSPEPTAASTPVITITPTALPTATPYTLEGYQNTYATLVANLATVEIDEKTLRYVIESRLIQTRLMDKVIGEVPCVDEQVWAQHILVADQLLAQKIHDRALAGEDWNKLAAEYSTDTTNKDQGGDLGWFGKGKMVPEFETAAFSLTTPGQISDPVKTQFGWHVIRLVSHEDRPLSASDCESLPAQKFQEWVTQQRDNSDVQIFDTWSQLVPLKPTLPTDIQDVVDGLRTASNEPQGFTTPVP